MKGSQNVLFMDNLHFLIELIKNEQDGCVITFHSPKPLSIKLCNIRVYLVNTSDFLSISALNHGIYEVLKKNYL